MYSISLPTTYGPAAYQFLLSPTGKATAVKCASLDLPEAVLKLTYPNAHPEDLREHLEAWLPLIPYLVELGIWLAEAPDYLQGCRQAFMQRTPAYAKLRDEVLAADLLADDAEVPHWQRANAWLKMGVARKVARFPLIRRRPDTVFAAEKLSLPYRRLAAAWLLESFPLAPPAQVDEWIVAIGKTRTTEGNNFLLRELERPGYLTYAKSVYATLANSRLKVPADRVIALYEDRSKVFHSVNAYVHLINQFPYPKIKELLQRIIKDYPHEAFGAVKRLYKHEPNLAKQVVRETFLTFSNYGVLIVMLRHMVRLVKPPEYFIALYEINERLTDAAFLDNAQVTWPQKLDDGWREVLLFTPPHEFNQILLEYLPEAKGRIARNLLLQLKEYLNSVSGEDFHLPPVLEAPLLQLLNSRYDKVSTVCTDVIRLLLPRLHHPELATQALLRHIEVSNYRMMDAAALKVAAEDATLKDAQIAYFKQRFSEAEQEADQLKLRKLLTYLRHLPDWRALAPGEGR